MISKLIMPEMNILLVPWKHKTQSKVTATRNAMISVNAYFTL